VGRCERRRTSVGYGDGVYAATTDPNFTQLVKMTGPNGGTQTVRGAVLIVSTTHNNEHHGHMVVYMRLKGTSRRQRRVPNSRTSRKP
jgi:hypothetical protein